MLAPACVGNAGVDFSGDYEIPTPQGPMALTLDQAADGTVTGTLALSGGTCQLRGAVVVDEEDEASVEGTMTCDAGGGEFDFSADDENDGFVLLVTPIDASGTPRSDLATLYFARPGTINPQPGSKPVNQTPQQPAVGSRDPRLFGFWSTQVVMNTPGGNMATQLLIEIRADGTLVDLGSRAVGGTADANIDTGFSGGGETVLWRTSGDILEVSYTGSQWAQLARFELSGDRLLLAYYDGDQKLWHRQR